MHFRTLALIAASTVAFASPALAHEDGPPPPPNGMPGHPGGWQHHGGYDRGAWEQQRESWLAECRRRIGGNSRRGVTGAVLGGVLGGVVGHEVAGRRDKTLGTVAGAAVGAVAGAAIERSTEGRRHGDECEAMLENQGGYGYGQYGYPAYGYAPMMMMVPVTMMAVPAHGHPKKDCKEVVTTEYVTTYDTVYRKVREVRYKSVPTYKRVRIVPDKRVRMVPDKRVISQ
jgi:uncharacterized protein YcfJ